MKNGDNLFYCTETQLWAEMDDNNDTFLDRPKGNQINAAYLLDYNDLENSGFGSHFGIQYLVDKRIAGQVGFDDKLPQISQNKYGVNIDINRFQVWNKTGYIFKENLTKASV